MTGRSSNARMVKYTLVQPNRSAWLAQMDMNVLKADWIAAGMTGRQRVISHWWLWARSISEKLAHSHTRRDCNAIWTMRTCHWLMPTKHLLAGWLQWLTLCWWRIFKETSDPLFVYSSIGCFLSKCTFRAHGDRMRNFSHFSSAHATAWYMHVVQFRMHEVGTTLASSSHPTKAGRARGVPSINWWARFCVFRLAQSWSFFATAFAVFSRM